MRVLSLLAAACAVVAVAFSAPPENPARELPGPLPDGAVLLPNQWQLRPAGEQVGTGDFPVNIALHPGGKFAAVLHCGYGPHEIVILDLAKRAIVSRERVPEAFYGLTFSSNGGRLFCSGSSDETVQSFAFADGKLTAADPVPLRDKKERGVPAGLALSADASTLYAANLWGQSVTRVRFGNDGPKCDHLPLGEPAAPAPAPDASTDDPSITKRDLALLDATDPSAPFPYACLLDEKRHRLYVSCWGRGQIAVIDTATFTLLTRWATDAHPNELLLSKDGRRLIVATANTNTVALLDTDTGLPAETLLAELTPAAPPGITPNALALSPDGQRLFVACANINAVAVFDIATPGSARALGFIPTGWYPTSVRVTADGRTLLVANGKGSRSFPNPKAGPRPGDFKGDKSHYIGGLMQGNVSFIPLPESEKWEPQMKAWTAGAYAGIPRNEEISNANAQRPTPNAQRPTEKDASGAAPASGGKAADSGVERSALSVGRSPFPPIEHVLYIIKENRTYDQVFGDMKEGNGDASLCLFPEKITPNHHALARQFVLLDNFYVDAEVSADGHEWSMAAYATDFVEKTWPLSYGHAKTGKYPYPSEGGFPIATPARGYLWDAAKLAGITYRSYGEFVRNGKTPADPCTARLPALRGHFDPMFRSFDMAYPDQLRADRFIAELHRFEAEGTMPRLQIIRLPNDHTSGTSVGKPTPSAAVADNDLALGRLVEAVTRSKFWPHTAIFVLEDDAQNGPDHIDAHRSPAFLISPYARHASVDSHMYSTSSALHTIELLLGLRPMSQFDAAARPLLPAFQPEPDLAPYTARPAQVDLGEKNTIFSFGARASAKMNFTREDAIDDRALNDLLWHALRGPDSRPPAPRRAAFVLTAKKKPGADDDDD